MSSHQINLHRWLLAACALASLGVVACSRKAEPEIHLIPAGYMGDVFILHNVRDGVPPKHEGAARVYEVPVSGVLRSQTPVPSGRWGPNEVQFFYVSEAGSRSPIVGDWNGSIHDTPENRADPSFGIYFRRFGKCSNGGQPCEAEFQQYYVGTKSFLLDRQAEPNLFQYLRQNPVRCE